jgi:hypothetical protein
MDSYETMQRVDVALSHVWMVRTFLKHSDEVEDDQELQSVYRTLYDGMHALGSAFQARDAEAYLKQLKKKLPKMRSAAQLFAEIQPEVSTHTNFQMAKRSLTAAMEQIQQWLEEESTLG